MKKCNKCQELKVVSEFYKSKKEKDGLQYKCKQCCAKYSSKDWYQKNKEKLRQSRNEYRKNRKISDPTFKLICNRRNRRWEILKGQKKNHTLKDLGCSTAEWFVHIESLFNDNMTWNNYGTYWHLDEIIPCYAWNMTNEIEQKACFHYLNSRPLEKNLNQSRLQPPKEFYISQKEFLLSKLNYSEQSF